MRLWPKPKHHLDWWFATKESLCKLYDRCNAFLRKFHYTKSKSFLQNRQSCFFLKWQDGKELEIYGKSFKKKSRGCSKTRLLRPHMEYGPIARRALQFHASFASSFFSLSFGLFCFIRSITRTARDPLVETGVSANGCDLRVVVFFILAHCFKKHPQFLP